MFATDAARSIRKANLVSTSVSVFIETNRFGKSPPMRHRGRSRCRPQRHPRRSAGLADIFTETLQNSRRGGAAYNATGEERKAAQKEFDDYVERHSKTRETAEEEERQTHKRSRGRSMGM